MVRTMEDAPGGKLIGPRARDAAAIFFDNKDTNYTPDEIGRELSLKPLSIRPAVSALKKTGAIIPAVDDRGIQITPRSTGQGGRARPLIWNPIQDSELSWQRINAIKDNDVVQLNEAVGNLTPAAEHFNGLEERPGMAEDNLALWTSVEKTDPAQTKPVPGRGGFTAIAPYYQIKNATAKFGAVGVGWGWNIESIVRQDNETIVVHLRMWHGDRANTFDVCGQAATMQGKKDSHYPDTDCIKKALTDGITKGISYLGFNADVFLGRFDDSKYVEQRTAEVKQEAKDKANASYSDDQKIADEEAVTEFLNLLNDMVSKNAAMQAINKQITDFNPTFKDIGARSESLGAALRAGVKDARAATME